MGREPLKPSVTESLLEGANASKRGTPWLFLVLESARPSAGSARFTLDGLDEVRMGRGVTRAAKRADTAGVRSLELSVSDSRMSSSHASLSRLGGTWVLRDSKSKNGTRVNGALIERHSLASGDCFETGGTFWCYLEDAAPAGDESESLIPSLAYELSRLVSVARSDVPVLAQGPSGSGKELVARRIHAESSRGGRFVAVNCGALPANLIESELFGHKKGAFSGATEDRAGFIKSADRGTLLLDEIGDLPLAAQAALLRVLQEREVVPVGSTQPQRVDVRVVAATHRDLDAMVADGRFRADLLARLRGFSFELPALCARRAEIGTLIQALLERLAPARASSMELSVDAARALVRYGWPLNVRELELVLAAALALSAGNHIGLEHLPEDVRAAASLVTLRAPAPISDQDADLKRRLEALLQEHGGSVSAVARAMGKERKQIRRWIARFGLRE
ncbi:MAG: hypothetical protein AMXMBFR56_80060 [Polyangiaceae bacterium]